MQKEKLIKQLLETDKTNIVVQICDKEGVVIYKDFSISISDEDILIDVEEVSSIEE